MNIISYNNSRLPLARALRLALCILTVCCWAGSSPAAEQLPGIADLSREESLRLGEQLYRKGLLLTGKPVTAIVQGDSEVEGTMFSCESCHMRSGLGSYEGGVLTTPTNGAVLYSSQFNVRQPTAAQLKTIPAYLLPLYEAPPRRPAYTDESLAVALRDGIEPTGRALHSVMPRYLLDDREMALLINYLKKLSPELSPGVTKTTLRFATVITENVSKEERAAMLTPLENYVRGRNSKAKTFEARVKYGFYAEWMDLAYRRLELDIWELKGPPGTWRRQLEEYYRKAPVFALLGGITTGTWKPVHDFSEEQRIPCLLPITDEPVISETDWYTLYFSKGLYQEGEAAARFLGTPENQPGDMKVLQIFRDSGEGSALAAGFQHTWQKLGHKPPVNRTLQAGETLTQDLLQQLTAGERPAAILLWVGPEAAQVLEDLPVGANLPERIFLSATMVKQNLKSLPEQVREITYITYPYALPTEKSARQQPKPAKDSQLIIDRKIPKKMHALGLLLTDALMMLRENFYRERFFEVIDMLQDRPQPYSGDYTRFSFGPGQRYASKGCYIVQLTNGAVPELVKKSEWVIH